jgi:hypothetical protein
VDAYAAARIFTHTEQLAVQQHTLKMVHTWLLYSDVQGDLCQPVLLLLLVLLLPLRLLLLLLLHQARCPAR